MGENADVPLVSSRIEPEGLTFMQPRRGYRFGPENLLLPDLLDQTTAARDTGNTTIVDLGAGCGVLGLLALAHLSKGSSLASLTAVERNPIMATAAAASIAALPSHLRHRATLVEADLRNPETPLPRAGIVICNPPFYPPGHGRPSSNPSAHEATHALHGGLTDFLQAAAGILLPDGRIFLLMPAELLAEACTAATALALCMRWCFVLDARHTGRPYRTWIVLRKAPGPAVFRHLCVTTSR